ncbi:AcrR family transcriptional regulator [Mycolicibacterium sp. BK556]|uniref:TetR/AcrR family transcriptional regulator n=1 Tax=Mycolicibacterium sp. BK556 TaxID=2587125 RepID=UPI00160DD5A0|nr:MULTISPECIES: TetR/AcrR family transcriptional regulator [unclassified Mycolicibacterium]MBB3606141.1 AcrR family transcriptional regulator [Mycolicibacterium sp. BK556]
MAVTVRKGRVSRAARREEIARRLFAVAEQLLAEGTAFAEISVEQLITGAEIARSTFYVYFEDKGELLTELAERVTQKVGEAADAWFSLPPGSTPADLKAALKQIADAYTAHRYLLAAVVETATHDARVRAQLAGVMERRAEDLRVGFRGQQDAGFIPAEVDVAAVAPWLTWMIERGLYELTSTDDDVDERLDGMTTVVWRTLYSPIA